MRKSGYKFIACFLSVLVGLTCIELENFKVPIFEAASVSAAEATKDVLEYTVTDEGNVEITGYTGNEEEVVIPSVIDGKPVTKIGEGAFYKALRLQGITIPDSVESIGEKAFSLCSRLKNVHMSESLISIAESAFEYCESLIKIDLPDDMENIGKEAFAYCSNLEKVELGEKIVSIGEKAFYNCFKLEEVELPTSLIKMGVNAFCYCVGLKNVTVSDNAIELTKNAFYNCYNIKALTIPSTVEQIDNYSFGWMIALEEVTFEGVTPPTIGEKAFLGIDRLKKIYVPKKGYDAYVEKFAGYLPEGASIIAQSEEYTVTFYDNAEKVISKQTIKEGEAAQAPADPIYPNAKFIKWNKDFGKVYSDLTVKPIFEYLEKKCILTVNDAQGSGEYTYLSTVTLNAKDIENKKFVGWKEANDTYVSYDKEYSFCITNNVELSAVYVDIEKVVEKTPNALLSKDVIIDRTEEYPILYFNAQITIPEGYVLVDCGTVRYKGTLESELTKETEGAKVASSSYNKSGQYIRAIKTTTGSLWNVRAYLTYMNSEGNEVTVYSNMVSCTP